MSQKYSSVVVGLGRIGALYPSENAPRSHTAAYKENEKVIMIAGVDPSVEIRLRFRELWGDDIKLFASVKDMIDAGLRPDIVSICTTPEILQENIKDFIGYNPQIYFLEKPAVSSEQQCADILGALRGIPVAVNYHRCWDPKHKIFFKKINEHKVYTIRVLYSKGLLNYASHIIALLIQNFGEIYSITKGPKGKGCIDSEDCSENFSLYFNQGFTAIFQGFDDINYDLMELDVVTDAGIYSLKSGGCRLRYEKPSEDFFYPNYTSLTDYSLNLEDGQVEGLSQAVENIVNFLDKKTDKLQCDLQCCVNVFKVIQQVKN
ncbi:Gfo/Idh/MocA family oxidoreductase [Candidatus Thioglobus sp.]|nr:Gfo/Idh/MocA family oxidoreductase [Candidatus Thioglobus sp.]